MSKKKEKKIDWENLEPEEQLKYEIAEELGLLASEKYYQALADNEAARLDKLRLWAYNEDLPSQRERGEPRD